MKYFLGFMILSVSLLGSQFSSRAMADSSPEASPNQVEIEEEATELTDLTGANISRDEAELTAPAQSSRHVSQSKKSPRLKAVRADARIKLAFASARKAKAERAHALYQVELARLQKDIAELQLAVADRNAEALKAEEMVAQDRDLVEKARRTRDALKKQTHKARRLHVAYEDPFN